MVIDAQLMVPIFIGGCPRSGTTLLGVMLGAHRSILSLPESPFIGRLAPARDGAAPNEAERAAMHRAIQSDFKFAFWRLDAAALKACTQTPAASYRDLIETYVRAFARTRRCDTLCGWIDHTPENMAHAHRLGRAFPNARFVHILRDGRAVAASWMPLTWGPNTILAAARTWAVYVGHGLAAEAALPAEVVCRVRYEELVSEPERVMRRLCSWLGLPFEPAMLHGGDFEVPAYTRSQHTLIGHPADPTRASGWRTRLSRREVELFEYATGDLLPHLGYELAARGCPEPSSLEKLRLEVVDKARRGTHLATQPWRLWRSLRDLRRERLDHAAWRGAP